MIVAPPEIEDGNVEYKRNFINVNISRLNHLTAQMNWRINEGNGICFYYLGVCDNGLLYENFTQEEIDYSLDIIKMMAEGCNSYIDIIIINRININNIYHIWFNIEIKRKFEFTTEYRILVDNNSNINKLFGTNKMNDIYFNTIIHNNEKYLFFECNKKMRNIIEKIIDFNLIVNKHFNNIDINNLMKYVENNMTGNNNDMNNNIIFNIIKHNYIPSIGHIIFGFLKKGTINNGITLYNKNYNKNIEIQVLSIHNNYIDCTEASSPATISLKIVFNDKIKKLKGTLFRDQGQNELEMPLAINLQELEKVRRQKALDDRKLRRLRRKEQEHL